MRGSTASTADTPALAPGDYICIDVTDTGIGMSTEVAARAFDPFFTTKPIGQGTGLGLSMIYGFARQSNGHATIDSSWGRAPRSGCICRVIMATSPTEHASAGQGGRHAATGETVLVVEDEPMVRAVILEMLGEQGYRTLEAVDGPSGLRILRTDARIDLLVTDVGLPGMNGRQLADQARETRPDLKILFITGYAESVAIAEGFLQPGMEMITKPFDLENLSQRIREHGFGLAHGFSLRKGEGVSAFRTRGLGDQLNRVTTTSPPATCRVFSCSA